MVFVLNHIPEVFAAVTGLLCLAYLWSWSRSLWPATSPSRRRARSVLFALAAALIAGMILFRAARVSKHFPHQVSKAVDSSGLVVAVLALAGAYFVAASRHFPRIRESHSPGRRLFLQSAKAAVLAAPVAATGYGVFVQRSAIGVREIDLPIKGLAPELDGLRMTQLSDIHLSAFLSITELARAVDMANELRPHLHLVTGDLITTQGDPLDSCLFELARLRSDAGTLGCLGNHEIYAHAEDYTEIEGRRAGIDFLRQRSRILNFRGKPISFAGVDYQRMRSPYLVDAEKLIQPGMPNILLSHNPDVFPAAARKGFDCTLSGHTHGGQITVEILNQNLSFARFFTPYVYGLYQQGDHSIYVTRGIGTVGVPARLGAPPEVTLLKLKAV